MQVCLRKESEGMDSGSSYHAETEDGRERIPALDF